MNIRDLLGSEIKLGDLVAVKSDHLVGVVARVEDGTIAKGLSVSGQPKGMETPSHILVKLEFTTMIPAIGGVANVLKISNPAPQEDKSLIQ